MLKYSMVLNICLSSSSTYAMEGDTGQFSEGKYYPDEDARSFDREHSDNVRNPLAATPNELSDNNFGFGMMLNQTDPDLIPRDATTRRSNYFENEQGQILENEPKQTNMKEPSYTVKLAIIILGGIICSIIISYISYQIHLYFHNQINEKA